MTVPTRKLIPQTRLFFTPNKYIVQPDANSIAELCLRHRAARLLRLANVIADRWFLGHPPDRRPVERYPYNVLYQLPRHDPGNIS